MLSEIRSGRKTHIRARTERRILAATREMASDRALVPAGPTWLRIDRLLGEGYTRADLAQRLGYKTPKLQIGKRRITVRLAHRVKRLHDQILEWGDWRPALTR